MDIRVTAVWNEDDRCWVATDEQTGEFLAEAPTLVEIEAQVTQLLTSKEDSGYYFSTRTRSGKILQ